jgi:NADH:ubiquinone oxidoreductase subunit C
MAVQVFTVENLAGLTQAAAPGSVERWEGETLWVNPGRVADVALFLRDDPALDFQFLNSITAVDYIEHIEVVYHLTSLKLLHTAVIKTRLYGREGLTLPSVYQVWRGADFQEREIWDLMGVYFQGHPNMKRIMLWEGFEGHPLRKDFL